MWLGAGHAAACSKPLRIALVRPSSSALAARIYWSMRGRPMPLAGVLKNP